MLSRFHITKFLSSIQGSPKLPKKVDLWVDQDDSTPSIGLRQGYSPKQPI
jgi:hypothetical protein